MQRLLSSLPRGVGRAAQPRAEKIRAQRVATQLEPPQEHIFFWFGRLIVSTAIEEGASDTTRLDKEQIISLSSPPNRRGARTAMVESHGPFFRQAGSFYRLPQSQLGIL